jgi:hypothetical protein
MMPGCALIATNDPPVNVSTFNTGGGDGAYSFDPDARTISVAYGTTATNIRGSHPTIIGNRYRISWTYSGATGTQAYFGTSVGNIQYRHAVAGDSFFDVTATAPVLYITFSRPSAGTTVVSNIVAQTIQGVTWVDTAAVTPAGWTNISAGVTVDGTTGAITIAATGTNISARQQLTTVAGTLYRVRWVNTGNSTQCVIGSTSGGNQMKTATFSDAIGSLTYEFRATNTTPWLQYQRSAAGTAVVSNIFLQVTA